MWMKWKTCYFKYRFQNWCLPKMNARKNSQHPSVKNLQIELVNVKLLSNTRRDNPNLSQTSSEYKIKVLCCDVPYCNSFPKKVQVGIVLVFYSPLRTRILNALWVLEYASVHRRTANQKNILNMEYRHKLKYILQNIFSYIYNFSWGTRSTSTRKVSNCCTKFDNKTGTKM